MWREIKRVMQLNLEVKASALQESPDIVILAGHSRLPAPELEKKIALTLFLGYGHKIQGLGSIFV